MERTKEARRIFAADIYATETTGIVIEHAEENYARCALRIEPRHMNANGAVMGGVLFTMADFTFAVAANGGETPDTVSISANIQYLNPAFGPRLVAETQCVKDGRSLCVYEVTITDEQWGRAAAKAVITGLRKAK